MTRSEKRALAQRAGAVIGIDAGKRKHAMVIRPRGGVDSPPLLFDTTREGFLRARETIRKHADGTAPADTLVGIEFAGTYGFTFAHFLRDEGFPVVSVLPLHSKRWKDVVHNQSLKTDPADAVTITDLAAGGNFVSFPFLQQVYADLRYLTSTRERLTKLRNGAIARLKDILHVVWPEFDRRFANFNKKTPLAILRAFPGPEALLAAPRTKVLKVIGSASRNHLGVALYEELADAARATVALPGGKGVLRDEIVLQLDLLASYERQIAAVEARMEEAFLDAPEAEALLSIPRLGTVMAAVFLGALGDPRAYETSRQALRVAGLSLTVHESGRRHGKPYLSKRGRPELRRQAYMFAVRSVSRGGMYRADYERLVANNGGRKIPALVALTRQAIRLMYSVAVDRRLYTPERPW